MLTTVTITPAFADAAAVVAVARAAAQPAAAVTLAAATLAAAAYAALSDDPALPYQPVLPAYLALTASTLRIACLLQIS